MTKRKAPLKRKKPLFSHHKHSGKHLAHHHTHYLPLLFLVLVTGFLLAGIARTAGADTISVKAKVSAPLPTVPAIITSPISGAAFSNTPVTIQGTCPAGYIVKINRNGFFSGSTICEPDDTFSLMSNLFSDTNQLTSHVFNITDDEGPAAPSVSVVYVPPVVPSNAQSSDSSDEPGQDETVPQMILKTGDSYRGYGIGQAIDWEFEIVGGTSPYAFSIEWGDGNSDVVSRKKEGKFKVTHTYDTTGDYNGNFLIKIDGTDQSGQTVFVQLVVLISAPIGTSSSTASSSGSQQPFGLASSIHLPESTTIIWGSYFGVLAGISSFWVGGLWQAHQLATQTITRKRIGRRL